MSNHEYLDKVVQSGPMHEVVGVVHDRHSLETLEECLMESGFDRGDIDIMANSGEVDGAARPGRERNNREAADYRRHEVLTFGDEVGAHVLAYGTLISIGSMGAAIPVVSSGGAAIALVAALVAGGAVGGGVGRFVRNRLVGSSETRKLERDLTDGGMAVLVRVLDRAGESRALTAMRECGADTVHVHDVEMMKTLHDIPLAAMMPDPWLGNQRLGG
jgi:hypothetical protein